MNERIKQLAEQAGLFSARPSGTRTRVMLATIPDTAGEIGDPDTQLEKFAELIVKECLQQCEQIRDDAYTQKKSEYLTESGRLIYEGVFGGATNCGFAIQQHFGVEE